MKPKAPTQSTTTHVCCYCGKTLPESQLHFIEEEYWLCDHCMREYATTCSHCGEPILLENNAGNSETPLCNDCYDDHYNTCVRCDRVIHTDDTYYLDRYDDDPYCHDCYSRFSRDGGIQDYYYKPDPIFYGSGSRYFGVELEIDEAGESDDNAEQVMSVGNRDAEHIYCKHDGSLHDGFEIVTHPMTLDYHMTKMPWVDILKEARSMGYISHQVGTCGLHVHVNRDSFGDTNEDQEACIGRLLFIVEKFWDELLKFSRRTQRQLDSWAARYGYKDNPRAMLEHAKKGSNRGRYACINLLNYNTVEFRIFRGTLKLNTLLATLQLVNKICDLATCLSDDEIQNVSWTTFAKSCTSPELVQYLKNARFMSTSPLLSKRMFNYVLLIRSFRL